MSEKVMTSDSELYNDIVEMLSNGSFLQLNGKTINLTELNEYINAQQEEIERLNERIKELEEGFKATTEDLCEESSKIEKAIEYIEKHKHLNWYNDSCYMDDLLEILDKEVS